METGRVSGEQDEEKRQEVRRKMEKDMEQVRSTSGFVTKLISTEIENLQAALDSSQRLFLQTDDVQDEKPVGYLNDIQKKFGFEKVGISDLEGNSLDNTGKTE